MPLPNAEPMAGPPVRPQLFDNQNQGRATYLKARFDMLSHSEDFEGLLVEWIEEIAGKTTSEIWGIPDKALNPMQASTRQLTVPGLYGRPPVATGPAPLPEPMGPMARYWPRMQAVQYYSVGLGVVLQHLEVTPEGDLIPRLVLPHNVVVWVDSVDSMRIVRLWELRLRAVVNEAGGAEYLYAWDQWDVSNPLEPSFRVVRADTVQGERPEDVTHMFLADANGEPMGPQVGPGYRWRTPDGAPFLPWVAYHSVDDGDFWPSWRRSMHEGTLRACTYWTYTGRSALFATGEHVIITGVDPDFVPAMDLHKGDGNTNTSSRSLKSMVVSPGSITFLPGQEGQNLQSISIGSGLNLNNLSAWANTYSMNLHMADGLYPSDATRRSANPTSGSALRINAEQRREFSAQVEPLFLMADLRALRICAWLRALQGMATPDTGYSLTYHTIPLSPTEQADLRAQLEWEEERGLASPVDAYMRLNPGVDRTTAKAKVISARVEAAELSKAVAAELELLGAGEPATPQDLGTAGARTTAILLITQKVASEGITELAGISLLGELFGMPESTARNILDGASDMTPAVFDDARPTQTTPAGEE